MATKVMALRRDDLCTTCSTPLAAGVRAGWDSVAKTVTCLRCVEATAETPDVEPAISALPPPPPPLDVGDPGGSARAEHARRQAKREDQLEQRWGTGRMGKVAKALSDDPATTKAWAVGASGEERVAQILHDRLGEQAVLLHDRTVPGTRGNIDHIAIAANGVWIIDAKKYGGKVEKRDVGGWFKTDMRLYVGGRDRTKTIKGLAWQVRAVQAALGADRVPIHAAVCFVGAEWPILFAKPFQIDAVWVSWPAKLAKLIGTGEGLSDGAIDRVARQLAEQLPSK